MIEEKNKITLKSILISIGMIILCFIAMISMNIVGQFCQMPIGFKKIEFLGIFTYLIVIGIIFLIFKKQIKEETIIFKKIGKNMFYMLLE